MDQVAETLQKMKPEHFRGLVQLWCQPHRTGFDEPVADDLRELDIYRPGNVGQHPLTWLGRAVIKRLYSENNWPPAEAGKP